MDLPLSKFIKKYGTRHITRIEYDNYNLLIKIWNKAIKIKEYTDLLKEGKPYIPSTDDSKLTTKENKNADKNIDKEFESLNKNIINYTKNIKEFLLDKANYDSDNNNLDKEFENLKKLINKGVYEIPEFIKNVVQDYFLYRNNTIPTNDKLLYLNTDDYPDNNIPFFNIYINKDKEGEYSLKNKITNIKGKNILPDFYTTIQI